MRPKSIHDLRPAVKAELIPFIATLGFRRGTRSLTVEPGTASSGAFYQRRWDDHFEEIEFQWDPHERPRFAINFWSDQADKMTSSDASAELAGGTFKNRLPSLTYGWMGRIFGPPLDTWYGQATEMPTITVAKARLLDLDDYLRYDIPLEDLVPGDATVMTKPDTDVARTIKEHASLINATPRPRPQQDWRSKAIRLRKWEVANRDAARAQRPI